MAHRFWERGLHQLIEIKEGCEFSRPKETLARISYQRFFRRYLALSGMTGTAREVAGELKTIYNLRVATVPTHRPMRRRYLPGRVYPDNTQKWDAVVKTVSENHRKGRPVLIGTRSVEASEHLSRLLKSAGLPHNVLNARQDAEEADVIAEAGKHRQITVATNMAGRGTDILLGRGASEEGGLHVIATEHHDARRIDRQLFGRCGRQGDPGSCEAIVSFEDELVKCYVGGTAQRAAAIALKSPFGALFGRAGRVVFRWAQYAAERKHARVRRDLLKFDEFISDSLAFTGKME
jgi:preprotein translocase subunit SecA